MGYNAWTSVSQSNEYVQCLLKSIQQAGRLTSTSSCIFLFPLGFIGKVIIWLLFRPLCPLEVDIAYCYIVVFVGCVWTLCSGCDDEEWACLDGRRCIKSGYVCNGQIDCGDGSDEWVELCASWQCPNNTWRCSDNKCITSGDVCDGGHDCRDRSDEDPAMCTQWNCTAGYWKCKDGLKCLAEERVCDGLHHNIQNCNDMSDEDPAMCAQWNCSAGYWKCQDGLQCVWEPEVCDRDWFGSACNDRSDENPAMCAQWDCPADTWKCKNGLQCIRNIYVCLGFPLCNDRSDEDPNMCAQWNCTDSDWKCKDGLQCIPKGWVCDGDVSCNDMSDVDPIMCSQWKCPSGYWKCHDGLQCVYSFYVCDGKIHCNDGSDEIDELCCVVKGLLGIDDDLICDGSDYCNDGLDEALSTCETWNCTEGRWKCNDFKCIYVTQVCDGVPQCNDGSDEQACANWTCAPGWHKCQNGLRCIANESVCDGKTDCPDLFDEDPQMCLEYQCPPDFEKCANNLQCVRKSEICDDTYHCLDISDEYCYSGCLRTPLGDRKPIIDKCPEDPAVCIPVDLYCDGVADCPDGSDERRSDCSCDQFGLMTYFGSGVRMCVHSEWYLQSGMGLEWSVQFNELDIGGNKSGTQHILLK